jgi:hypothetical protein
MYVEAACIFWSKCILLELLSQLMLAVHLLASKLKIDYYCYQFAMNYVFEAVGI